LDSNFFLKLTKQNRIQILVFIYYFFWLLIHSSIEIITFKYRSDTNCGHLSFKRIKIMFVMPCEFSLFLDQIIVAYLFFKLLLIWYIVLLYYLLVLNSFYNTYCFRLFIFYHFICFKHNQSFLFYGVNFLCIYVKFSSKHIWWIFILGILILIVQLTWIMLTYIFRGHVSYLKVKNLCWSNF
jgi:hypothetical protein